MAKLNTTSNGALGSYLTPEGVRVPRVTAVISVMEDKLWINKVIAQKGRTEWDRIVGEATTLGTRIHKVAADMARGIDLVPPDLEVYAGALREFMDEWVEEVYAVEKNMTSARLGFGGTPDLLCRVKDSKGGGNAVVDYKSIKSGSVTPIHKVQTAPYAMLFREHGFKVNRRFVVRMHTAPDMRGRWYVREATDHKKDVEAFRAALTLWNFLHGHKLRKAS